jgi:hypothetical protein
MRIILVEHLLSLLDYHQFGAFRVFLGRAVAWPVAAGGTADIV